MALTQDDVRKIAHLARLHVSPEELDPLAAELSQILALVEQMNGLDTLNVQPMAHPLDVAQRLRPDFVTENNRRERFQSIAPNTADGLYLVPRVIDG